MAVQRRMLAFLLISSFVAYFVNPLHKIEGLLERTSDQLFDADEFYRETCPPHPSCVNTTTVLDSEHKPCCACTCSDDCDIIGTCCADKPLTTSPWFTANLGEVCRPTVITGNTRDWQPRSHLLIHQCHPDFQDSKLVSKCVDKNRNTLDEMTPVLDTQSNISYVNKYCAACNNLNENDVVSWDIKLSCKNFKNLGLILGNFSTLDELIQFVQIFDIKCAISWYTDLVDTTEKICYLDEHVIDEDDCRLSDANNNAKHSELCRTEPRNIYLGESHVYKNIFCLFCFSAELVLDNNMCYIPIFLTTGTISFTTLLNMESATDTYNQGSHRYYCGDGNIYEQSQSGCVEIACPPSAIKKNGECYQILRQKEFIYIYEMTVLVEYNVTTPEQASFVQRVLTPKMFALDAASIYHTTLGFTLCSVYLTHIEMTNTTNTGFVRVMLEAMDANVDGVDLLENIEQRIEMLNSVNMRFSLHLRNTWKSPVEHKSVSYITLEQPQENDVPGSLYLYQASNTYILAKQGTCTASLIIALDKLQFCDAVIIPDSEFVFVETGINVNGMLFGHHEYFKIISQGEILVQLCQDIYRARHLAVDGNKMVRKIADRGEMAHFVDIQTGGISKICTSISIILLVVLICYGTLYKPLHNFNSTFYFIMISANFLAANTLLTFGLAQTYSPVLCYCLGIFTHYFWISYSAWWVVSTFNFTRATNENSNDNPSTLSISHKICSLAIAQLVSFPCIGVNVAYFYFSSGTYGYGSTICFITERSLIGLTFLLPLGICVLLTLVMYCVHRIKTQLHVSTVDGTRTNEEPALKIFVKLGILSGVMWVLKAVHIWMGSSWAGYLFIFLNTGQALLLLTSFFCSYTSIPSQSN